MRNDTNATEVLVQSVSFSVKVLESRAALEICGWGPRLVGLGDGRPPVGCRGEAPVGGSGGRSPPEAEALSEK